MEMMHIWVQKNDENHKNAGLKNESCKNVSEAASCQIVSDMMEARALVRSVLAGNNQKQPSLSLLVILPILYLQKKTVRHPVMLFIRGRKKASFSMAV